MNKKSFTDIRSLLFIFFLVRLFHITNPPLEVSHNWRQTTVTMVARNFYEVNPNICYPRVDFAGQKTGITGMEFPVLNYLIYLVSLLFGYEHWYGRLINLIISTIGIYFFYKLIKLYFKDEVAFFSSVVLLFSIWFPFSRKIMPDTFSFSLLIIALYCVCKFFEEKKLIHLILYTFFCLLGILAKLPSGYILIVCSLFVFSKNYGIKYKAWFITVTLLILLPVMYWYFYWVPYLNAAFDFYHFYMGDSIKNGISELSNHLFDTCAKFFDNAIKFIGFSFFLFGLYKSVQLKNKLLISIFSISFLGFLIVMFKAGFAFHHHNYYIIPFVPIMALLCGFGISTLINVKLKHIIIIAIALEGVLNYQDDFFIKSDDGEIFNLERDLNLIAKKSDLVIINSRYQPTPMYFTHRKGLITSNDSLLKVEFIERHKKLGYKFVVILKQSFGSEIILKDPPKINNPFYAIYKL